MAETFIVVDMSPARLHLLKNIASRWHNQICKALNVLPDQIVQVPLKPTYMLEATTQPRTYTGTDIAHLERNRNFLLTPNPNTTDINILSLNHGSCSITIYSKSEGITIAESKSLLQLNLSIELRFRLFEFCLQSDLSLRMVRPSHKVDNYKFEEKRITLQRRQDREDELKQIEVEKNQEGISNAVSASLLAVMTKFVQEDKERKDRDRRRTLEEIMERMKQEKDDTLLETPSLLEECANMDFTLNRTPQDSTENNLTYRTTDAPARDATTNFMRSTRTFTSLLSKPPPAASHPPHQSTPARWSHEPPTRSSPN